MKLRNKKTGEIWDIGKVLTNDYPSYDTLEQITEDFEDYNPPLIKDEKIRKAVRAWAEVDGIGGVVIVSKYQLIALHKPCSIEFFGEIYPDYEHNEEHTIAELCGEEEG